MMLRMTFDSALVFMPLRDIIKLLNDAGANHDIEKLWQRDMFSLITKISGEQRVDLILRMVAAQRVDLLRFLMNELGWDLDVVAADGRTPVSVAAELGNRDLLDKLLTPRAKHGFGLSLNKTKLKELQKNNPHFMHADSDMHYRKKKLVAKIHLLNIWIPQQKKNSFIRAPMI